MRRLLLFLTFLSVTISSAAQTVWTGTVTDSSTGGGVPYVMLYFKGTQTGCITDENGKFILDNPKQYKDLTVETMGYEVLTLDLSQYNRKKKLDIKLNPIDLKLDAAVIKPKRVKYVRKGNPAVDLVRKVINKKDDNRPEGRDCYQVEEYDKLTLALNDYTPDFNKVKKLAFTDEYVVESDLTGAPVLVLSVRERLSDIYHRKSPKASKTLVKAKRTKGYDEDLDPNGGITANLETLFKNVNIYDDDIELFTEHFTSPLGGEVSILYYKYYISDTTVVNGTPCTEISFVPANSESFGFTGKLYVANDSTYALRKAVLNTPANINLNWVDAFRFDQEFSPLPDGTYVTSRVEAQMNMSLTGGKPSVYAKKLATYRDYRFSIPDDIFNDGDISGANSSDLPGATKKDAAFWDENRHVELQKGENKVEELAKGLRNVPFIDFATKVADVIITDFAPTKYPKELSKVDIGNVSNLIGGNPVEGTRIRVGAQTTAALHPHLFVGGYLAYGTADNQLKHSAKLIWSFNELNHHFDERPRSRITLKHEYDLFSAEEQEFRDNIFYALKTGKQTTYMQYITTSAIEYEKEWNFGLTLTTSLEYKNYKPGGDLSYTLASAPETKLSDFSTMPISVSLRYAPGEKRFQSPKQNRNISKNVPIFNLTHSYAPSGIPGTDYGFNRTDFQFWKRTWLPVVGVVDTKVKAGMIWDKVPYPLLIIPATSQSLMFQKEAFHLMTPFEFVCDKYVSLNLTYRMKGLILNRIPLIQKLKWREVFIFDAIYGGLSNKNNPAVDASGLFMMPANTRPLGAAPYMEVGVGLENIFRVIHVYYIRRLNYLDTPECSRYGIRAGLHLDF